jgi:hypothetical protein
MASPAMGIITAWEPGAYKQQLLWLRAVQNEANGYQIKERWEEQL